MLENLPQKNLDWLFFYRVYLRPPQYSKVPRLFVYMGLFFRMMQSYFLNSSKEKYSGGLFYLDNTRHYAQAIVILPEVNNTITHNKFQEQVNCGIQIDITDGIYSSYRKLWKYLGYFLKEEKSKKSKIVKCNLPLAIHGILLYEHYITFLTNNDIKYVVIFTDHSYKNRALLFAAKKLKIKPVYIPHASVSEHFPPLEFDVAFLEGEDMQSKYENIYKKWNFKHSADLIMAGNIKMNTARRITNNGNNKKIIGIAFSTLDSLKKVKELVNSLLSWKETMDYLILIRPHPSFALSIDSIINNSNILLSDKKNENSIEFIQRIEFLLSGDSNIILEAALLKKKVFSFALGEENRDSYGFVEKRICPAISTFEELKPFILNDFKNYEFNEEGLQYYDYSFNRDLDSVKIVSDYLNKLT